MKRPVETDVGNITDPDLIASADVQTFESVDPRVLPFKGVRGSTDAFHRDREVRSFHQAADASIPNGVSLVDQQLRDTSIPVCGISQCQRLYLPSELRFRRIAFRMIVEQVPVEIQRLTNQPHRIVRP